MSQIQILQIDEVNSTQQYLTDLIRSNKLQTSSLILTKKQLSGIGSRNNSWETNQGDLIFSLALEKNRLPEDLPLQSASIYFAQIMLQSLKEFTNSDIFVKWPNDIYLDKKKVGGIITSLIKNYLIVGIGINLTEKNNFGFIQVESQNIDIVRKFVYNLEKKPTWKDIFQKYSQSFWKTQNFTATINNKKTDLKDAKLNFDGSILLNEEKIYSLR